MDDGHVVHRIPTQRMKEMFKRAEHSMGNKLFQGPPPTNGARFVYLETN